VVKEYQDEFFERHALVLDTGTRRGEDAAFEDAVALAASFVYTIDTQECLLDLLFVDTGVQVPIPPGAASCSPSTCWKCSQRSGRAK
jgi:hypothetical protein